MKRRLSAFVLLFALIFTLALSLVSCGEKYEPVESTSEEKRTVMKISYDGEKYEVPYELYRAFFLQLKDTVDEGNSEVWTGADKDKYVAAADELIYRRIAEIYAVFHLCEKADIDVYSSDFDDEIESIIEASVEGGTVNGTVYEGFDGDYQKYLDSLKEMNLNYRTQELLLRYQLAYEKLAAYYMGSFGEEATPGAIQYTKEDIKNFYSDEGKSRRIIIAQLQDDYFTEERALQIRDTIASKTSDTDVMNYIAGFTLGSPTSEVIGKYTYDKFYYSELTDAAFALDVAETSPVITLKTDTFEGYVIVYRLESTEEFFSSDYDEIVSSFLYSEFGGKIEAASSAIAEAIAPTDTLTELDRSKVSMD